MLPTFTIGKAGPECSPAQLGLATVASLFLYGLFAAVETVRPREHCLPLTQDGRTRPDDDPASPPRRRQTTFSLVILLVALVAVVGNAKSVSRPSDRASTPSECRRWWSVSSSPSWSCRR
ncbi:hypothetical protein [Streptomyces sp. NRRL WC-3549]|uniref:hypothetical protein n=1 Tax=Streptomyces sp. NRRL WC-3549 TaxID=1463925 RepID=UPI000690280B|nr:hypothetical protein [Streptomyces sp. NRRL WC-3549]